MFVATPIWTAGSVLIANLLRSRGKLGSMDAATVLVEWFLVWEILQVVVCIGLWGIGCMDLFIKHEREEAARILVKGGCCEEKVDYGTGMSV